MGVFVPQDPGASDALAKKGQIAFDYGKFWFKGMKMGTGQCNVKAYNRRLRDLIHHGKAKPSFIISHELRLKMRPMPTSILTRVTRAGPRSSFIQTLPNFS